MRTMYAVYRGDTFEFVGTRAEVAEFLGVKKDTVSFFASPANKKRREKSENAIIVERVEVDEE